MSAIARSTLRVTAASKSIKASPKPAAKAPVKAAPKAKSAPKPASEKTSLSILAALADQGLLSQVEKLGLLSKLEKAGLSLSKIEEAGLLSFAESSGVLNIVADKKTPGLLNTLGLVLLAAAVALVVAVPDDSTASVVAQGFGGITLGLAGVAACTGASTLDKFQRL
mmetsp:Transcript_35496/g.89821  ORF Transcript_35496/g.89821 Transcript_35496/m.89821 type:complete len:167 (-) Transcript_35496:266-766(-)|eukprot:CAMPEP_0202873046 /NCGR_PEP_ID=MMETSP1391-20130828/22547_1 /ASSEMBLY_ACC=CAM_ASM_000867 /TAXON_ID=1034604 /ORGANISM="Chlamydomonas leiostraca, Strain SAG 11-49" /LENGTH=166 /DNA_ID=CAMNT_0049554209 /DNA_START=39 /DNA_END=539 /DNA_ORIENTATION=+